MDTLGSMGSLGATGTQWGHIGDTVGTQWGHPLPSGPPPLGTAPQSVPVPHRPHWGPRGGGADVPPGVPPIVTCCEALLPEDEDMTMNLVGGGDG